MKLKMKLKIVLKSIRKRIKKLKKLKLILVGIAVIVSWGCFFKFGYKFNRSYNITNLPNSCFVDSMIYSSRCNLLLNSNTEMWNTIYGYSFYYKDDKENILGHAVCVFEYMNNLWIYDPNWGTSPICQVGDKTSYREKIKLYINKTYPIIVVEDFMLNDWSYVSKSKKNKMNETYQEVSIHLDKNKKE